MPAVIFRFLLDLGKKSSFLARHYLMSGHKWSFFPSSFLQRRINPPEADKCQIRKKILISGQTLLDGAP
jgi:hypothetical protein